MEHERSYFNEVLAPKLGRICSDRGVSFFNVDLRWGITEEDQVGGQVLPICLGEIDKCRPYFIGIIGNRYGSVMEKVPEHAAETIPWLEGKEGISITELEMLYAVLDHEKGDPAINSAFYMRSDRLSRELYPGLASEDGAALRKLDKLKDTIRSDGGVLCSDYDTIDEFGERVMNDLLAWLDENFPESGDVSEIRREWYNGEILRGHIENEEFYCFLDSYIETSNRSLLIWGDGARGKTASLTAWEPKRAKKILINCASDESYRSWNNIILKILGELCLFLTDENMEDLTRAIEAVYKSTRQGFVGDRGGEQFSANMLGLFRSMELKEPVVVVINDLNLLSDEVGRLLSWLPAEGASMMHFICSTNDGEMVENADVIGWNTKEMPLFPRWMAKELVSNSLRTYGKNLTPVQFELLLSSKAASYPGQLRFVISFLLNHGRFNNLDRLVCDISEIHEIHGIYRYVYDFLISDAAPAERATARLIFILLRASDIPLSEGDCFDILKSYGEVSKIEWARVCRIFEQFDLIHGDYWYIRDEETEKFVDELMEGDDMEAVSTSLSVHFFEKLRSEVEKNGAEAERNAFAYAKQCVESSRVSRNYDLLSEVLCDVRVIAVLLGRESSVLRSAWLEIFLESDLDLSRIFMDLVTLVARASKELAVDICRMIKDLDLFDLHREVCAAIGVDPNEASNVAWWVDNMTQDGIEAYQKLYSLKNKGRFRETADTAAELLAQQRDSFNETEICKILFFKGNAEASLGIYEAALATANDYYSVALKAGYAKEMQTALSMRASALYRLGKGGESLSIVRRTGKMAYGAGALRDYLSTLNMTAMCYYRDKRYDESIDIFDKLFKYWQKVGDKKEQCSTLLNKSNALYLGGRAQEALDTVESFYGTVKDDGTLQGNLAAFCGNMGVYAMELGDCEKSERYLLESIEVSKRIGLESTLANAYDSLANLYKKTDSLKKCIDLYAEQMEFHWRRREYEKVMTVYKKSFSWLSSSNHKQQALDLEASWKARFSQIEGGDDYFEQKSDRHAADAFAAEKLLERVKLAASAGDLRAEAEAYMELSDVCKKEDPARAAEYLVRAAMDFIRLEDQKMRIDVLEAALRMLFCEGQIVDMQICDTVVAVADDEAFGAIADIWRQLGDLSYAAKLEEEGKMLSEGGSDDALNSLIGDLLRYREKNEYLVVGCLDDLAGYLSKALSEDAILSLFSYISEKYRDDLKNRFDSQMSAELTVDLNYLMKNYFGKRADTLIARYEKYTHVLRELGGINAPAIAGNLALIYRRRKESEKAFEYHALSADLFRRAGKMDDCFIEILNGATARKELSSVEDAIELLRDGLREAIEKANRKYQAMIAGNLASALMDTMREEDRAEIESCFAIEERYFREAGYARDLTVSLVNQSIYYLKQGVSVSRWAHKVREARKLATEGKLGEFSAVLSRLEWDVSRTHREKAEDDDGFRKTVTELFEKSGYTLHSFDREEKCYYVIIDPKKKDRLYAESIHAVAPFTRDFFLNVVALISPSMYKDEAPVLEEYIEWWNEFQKYTLTWDKERKLIKANIYLQGKDWEHVGISFEEFKKMWDADKMNCTALMIGAIDLDSCRQAKLRTVE